MSKMAKMPVNKPMLNMGIPMIISMMLQAVYNIVDSAFILFAAFGLRDAITPIVSFNHGMGSKERVKDGIKYGLFYTLGIMLIGFVGLEILAEPFAGIFGLSGETKALCVSAMRIISISYVFAGANIAFQGIFQALDSGVESLIISVCRQFLFVIPVAYLFSNMVVSGAAGTWLVWSTFIIAEVLSVLVSLFFMRRVKKNKIEAIPKRMAGQWNNTVESV